MAKIVYNPHSLGPCLWEVTARFSRPLGMGHDQLFKKLLQENLQAFLELFFPDVARRLDFGILKARASETATTKLPEAFVKGWKRHSRS